jgi:hypothetical protein
MGTAVAQRCLITSTLCARRGSQPQSKPLGELGDESSTALDCEVEESPTCGPLKAFGHKFHLRVIKPLADLDRLLLGQQSPVES